MQVGTMNHNFRYILEEPMITADGLDHLRRIMESSLEEAQELVEDELSEDYEMLDLMP